MIKVLMIIVYPGMFGYTPPVYTAIGVSQEQCESTKSIIEADERAKVYCIDGLGNIL